MSSLPEHLRDATRARTENAEKRARAALAQLGKAGEPINFTTVARRASVSTDFLYKHAELRTLIERHRTKGGHSPVSSPEVEPSSTSAAVRALSERLARQQQTHRHEIALLRKALEVAQGENLELRRRLALHERD